MLKLRWVLLLLLVSSVVLVACGGDSDDGDDSGGDDVPVTTEENTSATEDTPADTDSDDAPTASGDALTYAANGFTLSMSSVDGTFEIWQEGVRSTDSAVILTFAINQLTEETFPEVNDGDMERFLFMPEGETFAEVDGTEYFIVEDTDTVQNMNIVIDERTVLNVTLNRITPDDITPYKEALLAAVPTISVTIDE